MSVVKAGGVTQNIPDIWLAGFCTANKCGVVEAVDYWLWQCELERLDKAREAKETVMAMDLERAHQIAWQVKWAVENMTTYSGYTQQDAADALLACVRDVPDVVDLSE